MAELQVFATNRSRAEEEAEREEAESLVQTLDSPDRGMPAWKFLLGAFVIEALLWGA